MALSFGTTIPFKIEKYNSFKKEPYSGTCTIMGTTNISGKTHCIIFHITRNFVVDLNKVNSNEGKFYFKNKEGVVVRIKCSIITKKEYESYEDDTLKILEKGTKYNYHTHSALKSEEWAVINGLATSEL